MQTTQWCCAMQARQSAELFKRHQEQISAETNRTLSRCLNIQQDYGVTEAPYQKDFEMKLH